MKILFLGTGAAEGIPALYCRCDFCERARKKGGKDIRTRSALRIGNNLQIDLSPETFYQMINNRIDMYELENVLITHSHLDHFQFEILFEKVMATENNGKPINLYLSAEAWNFIRGIVALFEKNKSDKRIRTLWDWVKVKIVKPYESFNAGNFTVTTVIGNHRAWGKNEKALNYLLTFPGGENLLYAVDTGFYDDKNWEILHGKILNTLIMECTFGAREDRDTYPESHLDINSFIKMLERMEEIQLINNSTRIFATHINPHHGMLHDELQLTLKRYSRWNITVAYDGLSFEI